MYKRVYRESDLLLDLFTPDLGKVTLLARGAKRSHKRFGGKLDLMHHIDCLVHPSSRFWGISEVTLINSFLTIRSSFKRFSYACHFLDIIKKSTLEHQANLNFYDLLNKALIALDKQPSSLLSKIQIRFYYYFLSHEGIQSDFTPKTFADFKPLFEDYTNQKLSQLIMA